MSAIKRHYDAEVFRISQTTKRKDKKRPNQAGGLNTPKYQKQKEKEKENEPTTI